MQRCNKRTMERCNSTGSAESVDADTNVDRFSNLCDDILLHILSLTLSYKTAVRCSVLSKRWISLHTRLPELHVHILDCFSGYDGFEDLWTKVSTYEKLVDRLLLHHPPKQLEVLSLDTFFLASAEAWLQSAAVTSVEFLTLVNYETADVFDNLFLCTSLKALKLKGFNLLNLRYPLSFTGFPHLRHCHLCKVTVTPDLGPFLGKFPVLDYLRLENVRVDSFSYMPSQFSIPSKTLQILEIKNVRADMGYLEIQLACPQMLTLDISDSTVIVTRPQVTCPQLKELIFNGVGLPETVFPYMKHAMSNQHGQLKFLNLDGNLACLNLNGSSLALLRATRQQQVLENVAGFSNLQILELSRLQALPTLIWRAVAGIPNLLFLALVHCTFLDEGKDDLVEESNVAASVTQVQLTLQHSTPGEARMLSLLTERCSSLQMLNVCLEKEWLMTDHNDVRYMSLREQLLKFLSSSQHFYPKAYTEDRNDRHIFISIRMEPKIYYVNPHRPCRFQ